MDNIVMGTAEGDSGEEGEIEETSHTPTQEDLNEDIQSILQRNVLVTTSNAVQEDRIHQIVHKYGINRLNEYRYTSGRHENGITHMCVTKDRLDVLRLLVKCGLDLNAQRPSDGSTCAHVAVRAKQNTMVNELRTLGADLTIRNKRPLSC
ncbi:hypothetical protein SARC_06651 [Sphaeroforma arctica JP610]|uniref:Uncharacterized protein n=1 Tax=Sphaeroforma arctica JP610 TaxID=667725 RepID=A0A0L0FVY1_9EUKA|nr:hypothetical protein SARC_06651 [Sphaeroforma arctica JP610]KNC81005.1 hypothetical protein SARC_06651 [Sphaeroforma arctica JP610]|eukprot:XP_014154907.1 hypothetical protein SARC_06651 [Sphaeroforma arctica JP610]